MNRNYICVFDFETGSKNPEKTQPTQLCAIMLEPRRLTVLQNGIFNTEIKPIFDDEKAIAAGFDPVEQEALDFTRKTREALEKAPDLKTVWSQFTDFIKGFNVKGGANIGAPIPAGYNINKFDMKIISHICSIYGPQRKDEQDLLNNLWKIDVMDLMFGWTENDPKVTGRKLVDIMDYLGMDTKLKANAHDALQDVKNTANILIKMLKFQREIAEKTKFNTAFAKGIYIGE